METLERPRSPRSQGRVARLVIVDSQPCFADGLKALLQSSVLDELEPLGAADSLSNAAQFIQTTTPDLVLVGMEPGELETLRWIYGLRRARPEIAVVLFVNTIGRDEATRALGHGVRGLLSKRAPFTDLTIALKLIHAGALIISPDLVSHITDLTSKDSVLDASEKDLLRYLSAGKRNDEIAKALALSESTLKRRMRALCVKLEVENRAQAIVLATQKALI